jgi:hypothetical protein
MNTTSSPSTAIGVPEPVFTQQEQLALAGFLAGYTGLTRQAYALDLRQYATWCQQRHLRLFQARRADIECFARDMEARGRARAAAGPARCRPDRPPGRWPRRHRQARAAHAPAGVHHRQLDAGVPLRDVQEAASHADPRTTMRYDRARASLDRHATYSVAAYVAGAAR